MSERATRSGSERDRLWPTSTPAGCRRWLALARRLVPPARRPAWSAEWRGELAILEERLRRRAPASALRAWRGVARAALRDALWLRLHGDGDATLPAQRPYASALLAAELEPRDRSGGLSGLPARFAVPFRFALRRLLRTPGFSLLVIGVLAGSIGALAAIASLVGSTLVRPLPYHQPHELVRVTAWNPQELRDEWLSLGQIGAWEEGSRAARGVAWSTAFPALWEHQDGRENVQHARVSPGYFELLGVRPRAGRLFDSTDDAAVAVLGHRFWRERFAGDPAAVGRPLRIDGRVYEIVGVAPATAYTHDRATTLALPAADVWIAVGAERRARINQDRRLFTAILRLAPGATVDQLAAELLTLQRPLALREPAVYADWTLDVRPLADSLTGSSRRPLALLLAAVSLLLVVVVANVGSLLLARFLDRRAELALHLALGGRRGAVAAQAACESLLLALAGGGLGLLLAALSLDRLPRWLPLHLARTPELALDPWPVAIALGAALAATVLLGFLPARLSLCGDLGAELRGARSAGGRARLRAALLVGQVAVTLPLLLAAGLLTRSLLVLERGDVGLRADDLWTMRLTLPHASFDTATCWGYFARLLEEVRALPGVRGAGASVQVPFLAPDQDRTRFTVRGMAPGEELPSAMLQVVTPGTFEAMGTALLEGRAFEARDTADAASVAIVNVELVRRAFDGRSPLGRTLEHELSFLPGSPTVREIVGVVEDVPQLGPAAPLEPQIYLPHTQMAWFALGLLLRIDGPVPPVLDQTRRLALELEPEIVIDQVHELAAARRDTLAQPRSSALLLALFAVAATIIAGLGLYALLRYQVTASTRELSLRLALGATGADLSRRVVARGLGLVALGLLLGAAFGAALLRWLERSLVGVSAADPWALVAAVGVLPLVAVLAAWLPARRASRVDPAELLR
ncbi:MAG TPA: ADOP family duplicated permease [Thermoanaerobaculia bacterium]|nr:ADOP family duplicated permease [Thermoanaerobaculia bacterium]